MGLVDGDFVTIKATLTRLSQDSKEESSFHLTKQQQLLPPTPKVRVKSLEGKKEKEEGLGLADTKPETNGKEVEVAAAPAPKRKPRYLTTEEEDELIWGASVTPKMKTYPDPALVPFVHSARLPFPKQEKRVCYLVQKDAKNKSGRGRIVALVKVPHFVTEQEVRCVLHTFLFLFFFSPPLSPDVVHGSFHFLVIAFHLFCFYLSATF